MNSFEQLNAEQIAELAMAICATAETLGQTISPGAADLMAEDLACYPAKSIAVALQACRRELTGKLTLAAILQRIQAADGRPEPNEAWNIALAASDEADSVVMTEEIQLALGAARSVLDAGDKIGARMAFLSAYARFVDAARREARPVKWSLSMGYDSQRRIAAVEDAARLGRLPAPQAQEYIAQLAHAPITDGGRAIAGLLTGNVVEIRDPENRKRFRELKADIARRAAEVEQQRKAERAAEFAELARRKAEAEALLRGIAR